MFLTPLLQLKSLLVLGVNTELFSSCVEEGIARCLSLIDLQETGISGVVPPGLSGGLISMVSFEAVSGTHAV